MYTYPYPSAVACPPTSSQQSTGAHVLLATAVLAGLPHDGARCTSLKSALLLTCLALSTFLATNNCHLYPSLWADLSSSMLCQYQTVHTPPATTTQATLICPRLPAHASSPTCCFKVSRCTRPDPMSNCHDRTLCLCVIDSFDLSCCMYLSCSMNLS